jgi:hypothetical protein
VLTEKDMSNPTDLSQLQQPFDIYRANLGFALRMAALLQESRQRTRQLETQAADSTIAMLRAAAQSIEAAPDWSALSAQPGTLLRDQAQMMAKFWEGWFGVTLQNGNSLHAGMDEAVKHWQSEVGAPAVATAPAVTWPAVPDFAAGIDRFVRAMNGTWTPAASEAANSVAPASSKANGARRGERHVE